MELTTAILFIVILILFALPDVISSEIVRYKDQELSDYKIKLRSKLKMIDEYNARHNNVDSVYNVQLISDLINLKRDL
jgi:hypothetical protein